MHKALFRVRLYRMLNEVVETCGTAIRIRSSVLWVLCSGTRAPSNPYRYGTDLIELGQSRAAAGPDCRIVYD
jgi:hypothetical protein